MTFDGFAGIPVIKQPTGAACQFCQWIALELVRIRIPESFGIGQPLSAFLPVRLGILIPLPCDVALTGLD